MPARLPTAMAADRGVLDFESLAQLERLREVTRGHLDVMAAGRRFAITGRITRTCGEFVRSIQTLMCKEILICGSTLPGGVHRLQAATLAAVLLAASITGPLVDLATHIIRDLGLAGVALLTITSGVIGVPGTEPTMLFAGFNVFDGKLTLRGSSCSA